MMKDFEVRDANGELVDMDEDTYLALFYKAFAHPYYRGIVTPPRQCPPNPLRSP
jgi:hypothetical protein